MPESHLNTELTVSPAKATLAPVLSFDRSIELDAGAEIPDKMILEHDATAEDIEAYAVTVHGADVPPLPPVAVGGSAVDTEPVCPVTELLVVRVVRVVSFLEVRAMTMSSLGFGHSYSRGHLEAEAGIYISRIKFPRQTRIGNPTGTVAVAKQLQTLEIFVGLLEQAVAHAGKPVVAVLTAVV